MATKKYFTDESLSTLIDEIKTGDAESLASAKSYTDTKLSGKADSSHTHDDRYYTESEVDTKISGVNSTISTHTGDTTVHITSSERTNWNSAYSHSTSTHAPSNAERNVIVGIQKNGTDLTVDSSTRKVNITVPTTAADIGAAASSHNHSASNITSGTLAIARGGTGASDAAGARTNLEVYSTAEVDTALASKASSTHNHDGAYDAKGAAASALASAKTYADSAATQVKNDLLNGAGTAYDTLKELGDLIDANVDAIDALETVAAGKADKTHTHAISDVSGLQSALDGKAASSHGTHVSFTTTAPKMNGTASVGTAATVSRSDHVHPTDTSRAAQTDLDTLEEVVAGKANASHTHTIANITDLQSTLDGKAASSHSHSDATTSAAGFMTAAMVTKLNGIATGANKTTVDSSLSSSSTNPVQNKVVNSAISSLTSTVSSNTSSISSHTTAIANLQTAVSEIQEITSEEISALFA